MKGNKRFRAAAWLVLCYLWIAGTSALADVNIVKGASPIKGDVLIHADDITLYNDQVAVTIAVGSPNFWGMTNGSISDIAIMGGRNEFGIDIINDVEFLVNSWVASEGSLKAEVKTLMSTPEESRVQAVSAWRGEGKKNPLQVVTTYTLKKNSPVVELRTIVSNPGPDAYEELRGGYSMSALSAYMFGPFGYHTPDVRAKYIQVGQAAGEPFGDFAVSYLKHYAVVLQMDGTELYQGTTGYKDLLRLYSLKPGEEAVFTGELNIIAQGHTTPFMSRLIEKKQLPYSSVSGRVTLADGQPFAYPTIIVEREGRYQGAYDGSRNVGADDLHVQMQPFIWHTGDAEGRYELRLPLGQYRLYATAAGFTPSPVKTLSLSAAKPLTVNFTGADAILPGGKVVLKVADQATKTPIDARIQVEGPVPAVKYLGASTYFTELDNIGQATLNLAAGDFTFQVMSGANFVSLPEKVATTVVSTQTRTLEATIRTRINPAQEKWYGVDLHHHSDIGDGSTSPLDLVRSHLASRLDLSFISDHDSVKNHSLVQQYSQQRNLPLIPSLEVSPGWGHFNILPMPLNGAIIDPGLKVDLIFAAAREKKGLVIVNHPYIDYGYFKNREIAPGGYVPDFDLIEIQPTIDLAKPKNADTKTLAKVMELWTDHAAGKNKAYYLTGGSDTHDVASATLYSGIIRTYARVEGELTPASYIQAVAQGHSYVSLGPLFFTKQVGFGQTVSVKAGETFTVELEVFAVNGLDKVDFHTQDKQLGAPLQTYAANGGENRELVTFTLKPTENTWCNLIARDKTGKLAISNPVWIKVVK